MKNKDKNHLFLIKEDTFKKCDHKILQIENTDFYQRDGVLFIRNVKAIMCIDCGKVFQIERD